jgi:DDE superfamily endonuclease/Helix-turn-helix of DDE superfamily endonuclease
MYHTTGLRQDEIVEVCAGVKSAADEHGERPWPPILGLYRAVVATLTYLRRNRVQAEIGEWLGVSQPTISRAITALTPIIGQVLADYVTTAEDLDGRTQYIVDGTLLPCWSWASEPQLYSGKHRTTGLNVQVVCDLSGRLVWISDPVKGHRHDTAALAKSNALETLDRSNWVADRGYIGNGMITPIRKPPFRNLIDWEKEFNTAVNKIRYQIERAIANLKTWRILHTDYRRPLDTFAQTISTTIALHFYATR